MGFFLVRPDCCPLGGTPRGGIFLGRAAFSGVCLANQNGKAFAGANHSSQRAAKAQKHPNPAVLYLWDSAGGLKEVATIPLF